MGIGMFLVFDKTITGADAFSSGTDGKWLTTMVPALDKFCQGVNLPLFTRFIPDMEAIVRLARRSPSKVEQMEMDFDPAEGLKYLSQLIEALQSTRPAKHRLSEADAEGVVECLRLLAQDLEKAMACGARFSLAYDT